MIRNPQIGMRVRFIDDIVPEMMSKIGTIIQTHLNARTITVLLDEHMSNETLAVCYYIRRWELLSDQDNKQYQEQLRQEEERKLDQQRRTAHADKYL